MSQTLRRCLRWVAVALWLAVIFGFSAQSGATSGELSARVLQFLNNLLGSLPGGLAGNLDLATFHLLIRKGAHLLEYLVLGALLAWAWRGWPGQARRPVAAPLLLAVACAALDELHQFFVPGRAAALTDVLIDATGATIGVVLVALIARRTPRPHRALVD